MYVHAVVLLYTTACIGDMVDFELARLCEMFRSADRPQRANLGCLDCAAALARAITAVALQVPHVTFSKKSWIVCELCEVLP